MRHFESETIGQARGQVVAWLIFTAVSGTVGYFELINHRAIANGVTAGLVAHALLFASLTLSLMGIVGRRASIRVVGLVATLAAAGLEVVEIVPTMPGSLGHWAASAAGIWLACAGAWRLGQPRSDVGMGVAALLWCGGLIAIILNTQDGAS